MSCQDSVWLVCKVCSAVALHETKFIVKFRSQQLTKNFGKCSEQRNNYNNKSVILGHRPTVICNMPHPPTPTCTHPHPHAPTGTHPHPPAPTRTHRASAQMHLQVKMQHLLVDASAFVFDGFAFNFFTFAFYSNAFDLNQIANQLRESYAIQPPFKCKVNYMYYVSDPGYMVIIIIIVHVLCNIHLN